jgi:hypothetical protein
MDAGAAGAGAALGRTVSQVGAMTAPAPCRLRVRYERAGRSFYSATAAGGTKMTPAQIAEAQPNGARVEAEVTRRSVSVCGCDSAPRSAKRMSFGIVDRVADDYPEVGLSSSSVGRR